MGVRVGALLPGRDLALPSLGPQRCSESPEVPQVEKLGTWQVTKGVGAVKMLAKQTSLLSPLCPSFLPLLVCVGRSWSTWYNTSNLRFLETENQSTMGRKTFTRSRPYLLETRG